MTTITDRQMTSAVTPHTARRVQLAPERWRASWCPERTLTRNQAVTAMALAELVDPRLRAGGFDCTDVIWRRIDQWAAELELTGPAAMIAIAERPHVLDRRLHVLSTSCWCEPATALDGHREQDGSDPAFAATEADPIDADGNLLEVTR